MHDNRWEGENEEEKGRKEEQEKKDEEKVKEKKNENKDDTLKAPLSDKVKHLLGTEYHGTKSLMNEGCF